LVKCAECGKEIPKGKEKKKVVEGTPQTYRSRCVDMLTDTERK
jgi:hypothetical protein